MAESFSKAGKKRSDMPVSGPRRITEFLLGDGGKPSRTRPDMVGSSNPRWARDGRVAVGQRFGFWEVVSDAFLSKWGALYVTCLCHGCGLTKEVSLSMMEVGRSKRCKGCATRFRHDRDGHLSCKTPLDRRIQKRVSAWFQRCNNPKDKSYANYGGRGIRCDFASVKAGVEYVREHLPHETYWKLDIDRIDNDGHYAPGNLRLVTREINMSNRRPTQSTTYLMPDHGFVLSLPG